MMKTTYLYVPVTDRPDRLSILADRCLEHVLRQMENKAETSSEDHRIRVVFSVDVLAYFFKLLHKSGALDSGPLTQLMEAISKNFVTKGLGQNFISPYSLTTKYKQVVQGTARTVRALLAKMLKQLDDEFEVI